MKREKRIYKRKQVLIKSSTGASTIKPVQNLKLKEQLDNVVFLIL